MYDFVTWDYSVVSAGAYPERVSSGDRQHVYVFRDYGDTLVSLATCCQSDR